MGKNTILALAGSALLISGALAASIPITRCKFVGYYDPGQILVIDARLAQGPWLDGNVSGGWGSQRDAALKHAALHNGVDIAAPAGSPVYATGNGFVEQAAKEGASGKRVLVRYGKDLQVGYSDLEDIAAGVEAGKSIERGQVIGAVGNHVRITIYFHRMPVEPMCWCNPEEMPEPHFKGTRLALGEK